MTSNKILSTLGLALILTGCGGGSDAPTYPIANTPNGTTLKSISGENVIPLTVNGTTCAADSYVNKPCVNVTICTPGTSNCTTVTDILVDTGSYGLRIFKSEMAGVTTNPVTVSGNPLAECVQYLDNSAQWGSVENVDVVLGGEPATTVPMHVVNSTFGGANAAANAGCTGAMTGPTDPSAGFNGILGVGPMQYDCGDTCVTSTGPGYYYSCVGASCTPTVIGLASQVQNPVALLPFDNGAQDNNGVILELPIIPLGGVPSVNGYLVLGINTRANNVPSGVTTFSIDPDAAEFTTTYNGSDYTGFIDSGSNTLYIPPASQTPDCGSTDPNYSGLFCPSSTISLSASNTAFSGSPTNTVEFQVGNYINVYADNNSAYVELAGDGETNFDWGLPFFFGRNVYVGIKNQTSTLGTGPYWSY